jgi:sensor histidine kinase YesM
MVLQVNYENDLKTEQLNLLAKENDLNKMKFMRIRFFFLSFAGLTVILGLILLLFYQKKRMKSEQKSLILEQKLLRSQMNPHFLFNSLTSIQNFIVCEKPDAASIYLSKFSKLVRNILDNSVEEYVPLEKEISTIENYIELQRVRWAGKFDYCIKIAPEIDDENIMIPPMLAQPFIENAIEHGVKHRQTPGFIDIRFTRKNHSIIFEIEDNGVGREKAREFESLSNDGHRSMATSITRERLDAINKKQHRKITLEITDLKNESGEAIGTLVTFGIPIQNS